MKILITGNLGYIGFPLALELLETTDFEVIGVDNDSRNDWVEKCGGERYYPQYHHHKYTEIRGDLTNRAFVDEILCIHKPDCIIHLASQPSMPYSQINGERALYTQENNIKMCLNLLWGIHENNLKSRFILTTTTGIPGQHYRSIPEQQTINSAGSWYHISRGFDSANCALSVRQWGLEVIEFRTSIVYGIQTPAMFELDQRTRFDTDFYFGTVLNRFIKLKMDNKPITVYGKGKQTKPFISLEDTVISLKNAITYTFNQRHTILNQTTHMVSIVDLANMVGGEIKHIKNPRKENETFKMRFENEEFLKVLKKEPTKMKKDISQMLGYFMEDMGVAPETWTQYGNKDYLQGTSD